MTPIIKPAVAAPVPLLCVIVFLGHFAVASGTIFSSDGAKRFEVARNLIEHGRVDIQTPDRAPIGVDGKQYAQYAIGHSALTVPFYLVGKQIAVLIPQRGAAVVEFSAAMVNLVATVLLVGWLAVFARELGFGIRTGVVLGLLYAFGTMAWQQSKDSFEHPQVALYFTILFYGLHRFAQTRRRRLLVLAGMALGLAVITRYTAVLACGAVVVFLSVLAARSGSRHRLREALTWSAVIAVTTLPFVGFDLWFNYVRFGAPFETGQQQLFGSLLSPATFLRGLWGLTFDWEHGVFVFNPILLLGFWAVPRFVRRHRALAVAFLVLVGLHLVFYALTKEILWTGGWAWGPRFFVDVLPLMVLMCGPALEAPSRKLGRSGLLKWAVAMLAAVSVLIQVESVLVNSNRNYTKKAGGIDGYSYDSHGVRDSLIYMQAESVWQVSRDLLNGRGPSDDTRAVGYRESDPSRLLNDSVTFGTFQIWWVYALHFRIARGLVLMYLAGTALTLVWAIRTLRRRLGADARQPFTGSPACPCTLRSSIQI